MNIPFIFYFQDYDVLLVTKYVAGLLSIWNQLSCLENSLLTDAHAIREGLTDHHYK